MQFSNGKSVSNLPESQPNLFGIAVPRPDPTVEMPSSPPLKADRQDIIERTLEQQTEDFKTSFRQYVSTFYKANKGTAADVIAAYKRTALPKPVSKDYRCVGGIFQSMVRSGEIHSIGTEKAKDGSGRNMDVYEGNHVS